MHAHRRGKMGKKSLLPTYVIVAMRDTFFRSVGKKVGKKYRARWD
jgi:hypothetical protein